LELKCPGWKILEKQANTKELGQKKELSKIFSRKLISGGGRNKNVQVENFQKIN